MSAENVNLIFDLQMSNLFRRRAQHLVALDAALLAAGALVRTVFRTAAPWAFVPFVFVVFGRMAVLFLFLARSNYIDVFDMNSPFKQHRQSSLRRYALLTNYAALARWMLINYVGLVASVPWVFTSICLQAALERVSAVKFFLLVCAAVLMYIYVFLTRDLLYTYCVQHAVDSVMCSRARRQAYATARSNRLLATTLASIGRADDALRAQQFARARKRQSQPTAHARPSKR